MDRWGGQVTFLEVIPTSHLVICCWANDGLARPDTLALASECLIASGPRGPVGKHKVKPVVTCRAYFIAPIRGSGQCTRAGIKTRHRPEEPFIYIWKEKITVQIFDQYWDLAAELSWLHEISAVLIDQSDSLNRRWQCIGNDRCLHLVLDRTD